MSLPVFPGSAVFLQARLGSTRLPAKALFEIGGKTILSRCMETLRRLPAEQFCLLCDGESLPIFESFAREEGFAIFGGQRDDVLGRFVGAITAFGVSHVFRATADNPAVSLLLSSAIIREYVESRSKGSGGLDYCVFRDVPKGSCIEAVSARALLQVNAGSRDPIDHEHVCPGVYHQPEKFSIRFLDPPDELRRPDINVSIDTINDYISTKNLLESLPAGESPDLGAAIAWWDKRSAEAPILGHAR